MEGISVEKKIHINFELERIQVVSFNIDKKEDLK